MNQSTDQPVNRVAAEIEYDPLCGIAIQDVPDKLPRRNGKKVNFSTVWRWAMKGYSPRGARIVLETTLIGRCRYTSRQALRRFNRRRNALDQARPMIAANLRLACGPKTNTAAKRYLEKEGFSITPKSKGLEHGHGHGTDAGRMRTAVG